ncbi:MAG: glycosyltransferase [Gammaproteobacteria bacterium]|nr:glycosyltransferase [Gammaproteobacteria bacterium]
MFRKPLLSVIVNFYNMRREAKRVLLSLSTAYQQNISAKEYEVIAIDNGSSEPLDEKEVVNYGRNFRYYYHETDSISPAGAIKAAAKQAKGKFITVCIDGARILSPGSLHYTAKATRIFKNPVVTLLSWHLGNKLQNESVLEGYNQAAEDEMLEKINWEEDGYRLFDISCLAGSCRDGWFMPFDESNCITVSRQTFERLGGFDQNFQTSGGGLVNLDYFKRACDLPDSDLVVLLGEGIFHQFHGGVATNVPLEQHPMPIYAKEYESLRGSPFTTPQKKASYLGCMPPNATRFLADSANNALAAITVS